MPREKPIRYEAMKIILGDCLEVLPTLERPALIVTSPPYNMLHVPHSDALSKYDRTVDAPMYQEHGVENESVYQAWMRNCLDAFRGHCDGSVWINHKIRFRNGQALHPLSFLGFDGLSSEVIWARAGSWLFKHRRFATSHEVLLQYGRPVTWRQDLEALFTVWEIGHEQANQKAKIDWHPCPFPVEIPMRLIEACTSPGDLVIDPFCGAATTGVACARLGRRFIGIEKDPRYIDKARERLDAANRQLSLGFDEPAAKSSALHARAKSAQFVQGLP